MATEVEQECGSPRCPDYGTTDGPENACPDDHIMDRHPGTDPDWKPSTYRFHDDKLAVIHTTQTPIDDESALAYFHKITSWGKEWNVAYISKAEPGSQEFKMLPYKFHEGMVEPL